MHRGFYVWTLIEQKLPQIWQTLHNKSSSIEICSCKCCDSDILIFFQQDILSIFKTCKLLNAFIGNDRCGCPTKKKRKCLDFSILINKRRSTHQISISQAQAQLTKTAEAAADLGLVISAPKTECVTVNWDPQPALQVYGDPISHVSDFIYLGSMLAFVSSDLKRRKPLAWCILEARTTLEESAHTNCNKSSDV